MQIKSPPLTKGDGFWSDEDGDNYACCPAMAAQWNLDRFTSIRIMASSQRTPGAIKLRHINDHWRKGRWTVFLPKALRYLLVPFPLEVWLWVEEA